MTHDQISQWAKEIEDQQKKLIEQLEKLNGGDHIENKSQLEAQGAQKVLDHLKAQDKAKEKEKHAAECQQIVNQIMPGQ